ncbi:MAG: hypothetical protein CRN43_12495 [Candidatus Nephrothrix sp. EaCA]|nr:MAG: hypothetical protein CRN43_12495 [Candidatus Nephrothrix sp. EaCA]
MSCFFLNNQAINNAANYDEFKEGLLELIAINKQPSHSFYRHDSIYSLPILINGLYVAKAGKDETEIYRFLEQLTPCERLIETEPEANTYCKSTVNGFLGIKFNAAPIRADKQLTNNEDYKKWCFSFLTVHDFFLTKSAIAPEDKKVHLSDHHGKKELNELCDRIKNCPYVEKMQSTNWGGKKFIRKAEANGLIEIVLYKTDKQYALNVQTTGRDLPETQAIAQILRDKYDN